MLPAETQRACWGGSGARPFTPTRTSERVSGLNLSKCSLIRLSQCYTITMLHDATEASQMPNDFADDVALMSCGFGFLQQWLRCNGCMTCFTRRACTGVAATAVTPAHGCHGAVCASGELECPSSFCASND